MGNVMALRKEHKDRYAAQGQARRHRVHPQGDGRRAAPDGQRRDRRRQIIYRGASTSAALSAYPTAMVFVIKNADHLSVRGVAIALEDLAARAGARS